MSLYYSMFDRSEQEGVNIHAVQIIFFVLIHSAVRRNVGMCHSDSENLAPIIDADRHCQNQAGSGGSMLFRSTKPFFLSPEIARFPRIFIGADYSHGC